MNRLIFFLLFFPISSWALFYGNPSEPKNIEDGFFSEHPHVALKIGYEKDFVFDRNMKGSHLVKGPVNAYTMQIDEGILILNFIQRIEAYGIVGASTIFLSQRPDFDGKQREYQTNSHLAWGGGVRGVIYKNHSVCVGADLKYLETSPSIQSDTLNGAALITSGFLTHREWQISAGVSYKIDLFIPYLSFSYSQVRTLFKNLNGSLALGTNHFTLKNRQPYGMAIGFTLSKIKKIDLNLEFELIAENALTLSGNIQF